MSKAISYLRQQEAILEDALRRIRAVLAQNDIKLPKLKTTDKIYKNIVYSGIEEVLPFECNRKLFYPMLFAVNEGNECRSRDVAEILHQQYCRFSGANLEVKNYAGKRIHKYPRYVKLAQCEAFFLKTKGLIEIYGPNIESRYRITTDGLNVVEKATSETSVSTSEYSTVITEICSKVEQPLISIYQRVHDWLIEHKKYGQIVFNDGQRVYQRLVVDTLEELVKSSKFFVEKIDGIEHFGALK